MAMVHMFAAFFLLLATTAARPTFRPMWDLPGLRPHSNVESHNFEHRDSLGRVTKLRYVAKMKHNARSLDDVSELESVVCEGDTMVLRFSTDMREAWSSVSVVAGGAEWGCAPSPSHHLNASTASSHAARDFKMHLSKAVWSDGGKQLVAVSAPATHADIFSRLKIDFETNNISRPISPQAPSPVTSSEVQVRSSVARLSPTVRPRRRLMSFWSWVEGEWEDLESDVEGLVNDVEDVASDVVSAAKEVEKIASGDIEASSSHSLGSLSMNENFNFGPVKGTAKVDFDTTFHFNIDVEDGDFKSCKAYLEGQASWDVDMSAYASYSYSNKGSRTIKTLSTDFNFYAGIPWHVSVSVPVQVGYSIKFNGQASIEINAGQTYTMTAGYQSSWSTLDWEYVFEPFHSVSHQNHAKAVSTFSGAATGIVFVRPVVVISVDDTLAPYIGVQGSLTLAGKTSDDCDDGIQVTLGAKAKVQAGMKLEGFVKTLVEDADSYNIQKSVGPDTLWKDSWPNLYTICV